MLESIINGSLTLGNVVACTLTSLVLGLAVAWLYMFRSSYTKSFAATLVILPAVTQVVVMLVSGNLGTAVAVAGAFSLVRFRSAAGSAREIGTIFLAMALGLCTGSGYLLLGAVFLLLIGGAMIVLHVSGFGETKLTEKELRITVPESLDYEGVFDDLLDRDMKSWSLEKVKTSNMGSLYELTYRVTMASAVPPKAFLDDIRCRNGNLPVSVGRVSNAANEL